MVIVEKSFPRGGSTKKETTKSKEIKETVIFGAQQKDLKHKKNKPKKDLKPQLDKETSDHIETSSAELLNYDTIQDGMNIMCRLISVDQLHLKVSLPGRMVARVSVLEISNSYTKLTQNFLQNSEATEHYKPLKDMFVVGQVLYGRVQQLKQTEEGRTKIIMSLKPSEVHADLVHTKIEQGFIFSGAIEEVQEHGYIIESGIKNLRAFLPIDNAIRPHTVGELIYLKVDKMKQNKVASTCTCKEFKAEALQIKDQNEPKLDYLMPASIVQFHVTKRLKDGLQGTIMHESFTAYINEHQLAEPLALPVDYEVKSTLKARILYIMPLTKLVYLTLNHMHSTGAVKETVKNSSTIGTFIGPQSQQHYQRGDVIKEAKVHHIGTGGVILVLDKKIKGIISLKTIKANYKGNYDYDDLLIKYAKQTQHTVRVLGYDLMDEMYICTDHTAIINEKVFSLKDMQAGDFQTAVVLKEDKNIGGYKLQVGKIKGIIEKLYLAPNSKALKENSKIRCRVVAVNPERQVVYMTNRPEYMSKSSTILTKLEDAKKNTISTGTVVKCYDSYVLIKFFNNLKGVLRLQTGDHGRYAFYEGQTMQFRILERTDEQVTVATLDDAFELGEICMMTVCHVLDSGLEVKAEHNVAEEEDDNSFGVKGLLPLRFLSDFGDLLRAKLHMYSLGAQIPAVSMTKNIFSLRDVNYFQCNGLATWTSIEPGDVLRAFVKNVATDANVVELLVPIRGYEKAVKVHHKMMFVNAFQSANIVLSLDQVLYVKILSKVLETKTITVSAKLTDVWDQDLSSTSIYMESYLDEVSAIKQAFQQQLHPLGSYSLGQQIDAIFNGVNDVTGDWLYEVLDTKVLAVVKPSTFGKAKIPKVGEQQTCIVLWIDYSNEMLYVSNKTGDMQHISHSEELSPTLMGKTGMSGTVLLKLENLFICSLKKGQNPLIYCPSRLHYNDFENSTSVGVKEREQCRLSFIHKSKPIAVLENTWKLWQSIKRKRKISGSEKIGQKKAKTGKLKDEVTKATENKANKKKHVGLETTSDGEPLQKKAKARKNKEVNLPATILYYEDKTPDYSELSTTAKANKVTKQEEKESKTLPGITNFWSTDLDQLNKINDNATMVSSDEDDQDDESKTSLKKKRLNAVQKFKKQREEEVRLRAIEAKYADPNQLPESVDQFDRLVLAEPQNSKHWINYMVFHLQATEIDKARAVARRAIKSISFRCDNELLNIWVALLNLELRYGNKDSFDETFKEALTYNDPLKVYMRALEILSESGRQQQLIELIGIITKKFKAHSEVWKATAEAYFSIKMPERAQHMLHKALDALPEREHVNTIVMFANLNQKHGCNEMAQTLMEQVITSYPKRVDVWTQYIDMLIKVQLIDSARNVLERAVIQKIPLKKMRTIFKKYLEFEERFGTEADVQKVKNLAAEYVKHNATL